MRMFLLCSLFLVSLTVSAETTKQDLYKELDRIAQDRLQEERDRRDRKKLTYFEREVLRLEEEQLKHLKRIAHKLNQ